MIDRWCAHANIHAHLHKHRCPPPAAPLPFLFLFTSAAVSGSSSSSSSGGGITTQPHFVAINTLVVWWSNCIRFLPLWQVKTNVPCHRMWWWSVLLPNKQEFPDYHEYLTESLRLSYSVCSLWPSWVNGFFFWALTYIHACVSYRSCVYTLVCGIWYARACGQVVGLNDARDVVYSCVQLRAHVCPLMFLCDFVLFGNFSLLCPKKSPYWRVRRQSAGVKNNGSISRQHSPHSCCCKKANWLGRPPLLAVRR